MRETNKDYVVISWESPDSDGGSPLTGFIVERKDVTKTSFVSAGRCDVNTFNFKVTKLIEGNEYEFHVAAENDIGQSDWASLDKPVKAKLGFGTCYSYLFFTARRCASAVSATALRPSVHPSVRHKSGVLS